MTQRLLHLKKRVENLRFVSRSISKIVTEIGGDSDDGDSDVNDSNVGDSDVGGQNPTATS